MSSKLGKKVREALKQGDFVRSKTRVVLSPGQMVRAFREKTGTRRLNSLNMLALLKRRSQALRMSAFNLGLNARRYSRVLFMFILQLYFFKVGTTTSRTPHRLHFPTPQIEPLS